MALSDKQWEMARMLYERGLSLSDIAARTGIKSKGSISKRAKKEGWVVSEKKKRLISEEVEINQQLKDIEAKKETIVFQKETLPAQERTVHDALVQERLERKMFFDNASITVAKIVVQKLHAGGERTSFGDLKAAAETIGKAKDNVLGKEPDVVINNTNAMQSIANIAPADVKRLNAMLEDEC